MDYLSEKKFDFVSSALPADTFGVVRFKGTEGFSMCYEFEINLVSKNAEIDLTEVLKNPGTFTILRKDGDIPFHGILTQFEQLHEVDEYVFYRAILVPKLWWLSLTHHNQVILNKTVPEVIKEVLKDGGLTTLDFELKLQKEYPKWDYICQYGESHLNFVSRWMEREGMYYYFEQTPQGEKAIITDTKLAHTDMPEGKTMYYSPVSGLDDLHREEVIKAFICRQKMLPRTLHLKDYNYMKPSMEITGSAEVSPDGRGEVYIYGEHFRTTKEGNNLAKIRAEELLCQEKQFHGESTIPYLRPGYLFDLEDHYRKSSNNQYLTIELEHEGSQASYLIAGIQKGLSEVEEQPYYFNNFEAITSDVQFRPPQKSEKPRFYGTLNAKIDAAGSGKYAELDDQGRYKVVLPFDKSGRKDGKASAYFRMAQPYAGTDHGMHFPLHKGTEVLLAFIDGDPDRPIINAAVPNPETPSQITSGDQTMSKITTAGGNKIHIEDQEGSERILMHSPNQESFIRIGAHNDPGDDAEGTWAEWHGISESTKGAIQVKCQTKNEFIGGECTETIAGLFIHTVLIVRIVITLGMYTQLKMGGSVEFTPLCHQFREQTITINGQTVTVGGEKVNITGGNTTVTGNSTNVTGDNTNVTGANTVVRGEHTAVSGANTAVHGEHTAVSGANTVVRGEHTAVSGADTVVNGEHTAVHGANTSVSGENTQVSGNVTNVTGENTTVSGNVNHVSGNSNIISGQVSMI
ncbi:MAG: type VI secretion system tip protein TssI/VgrG [Thermodesulfobacteriota bacterium]|nr:type VI secretion system tip protein TssI/VgrG [Thermodesulfobacteriota bacterium]